MGIKGKKIALLGLFLSLLLLAGALIEYLINYKTNDRLYVYYDKDVLFSVAGYPRLTTDVFFDYASRPIVIKSKREIKKYRSLFEKYSAHEKPQNEYQPLNELFFNIVCIYETPSGRDTVYLDGYTEEFIDTLEFTMLNRNKQFYCNSLCHYIDDLLKEKDNRYKNLRNRLDAIYKEPHLAAQYLNIRNSRKSEETTEERVNTISKRNKVILGDKLIKVTIEYNREDTFCSIDEDGEYLEGLLKHRHNRIIITDTPTLNFFESWKKRVVDSLTDEPCEYYLTSLKAVIYYYKHHSDTLCLKRYPSKIQFNHLKSMDSTYFFMVNSYLNLVDSTWRKNNGWVYEENSEIRDKYSCIPYTDKPWPQIAIPKQIKED